MAGIRPGRYRHFKGKEYEVIGIARHSETDEELVVYRSLYDHPEHGSDALWTRPLDMFTEMVEKDGELIPRFNYIEDEDD